jgi:hypothetical protein
MQGTNGRNGKDNYFGSEVDLPNDPVTEREGKEIFDRQDGRGPLRNLGGHLRSKGWITEIFPEARTYTVITETDQKLVGVQRLLQDPGDDRILPVGCQVTLTRDYGPWLITGCLNFTRSREADEAPQSLTGVPGTGADDALYQGKGVGNFRTERNPRDMGARDWAQVGRLGNAVAVLDGGVSIFKASEFAQLRAHIVNDLVELFSRNWRHVTDMGFSEIKNDGGRISFKFRGASDQLTEAGADQENWTIRLDLGNSGDLFNFELTRPDGGTLFKFHVSPDGKCSIFGEKGVEMSSGQNQQTKNLGNEVSETKGTVNRTIGGTEIRNVRSNRTANVSGTDTHTVGTDNVESIVRDEIKTIGGKTIHKHVGGNPATAKPGDIAYEKQVANGSMLFDIGDPAFGSNPAALAGFLMRIFKGDWKQNITTAGNIEQTTNLGNIIKETKKGNVKLRTISGEAQLDGSQVRVGGSGANEPLLCGNLWSTWVTALLQAIMTLSVPTGVGPSGIPINAPAFAALKAQVSAKQMLSNFTFTEKIRVPT